MYRVHHFENSVAAYDACLDDSGVEEHDVIVVASEHIVGLASCDPIAVTIAAGAIRAFPAESRDGLLDELVHDATIIGRAVAEALRHRFPVAPSFLPFAERSFRTLPSEVDITLTLDDIMSIGDAIDHRIAGLADISRSVDPESSRGLFLARAMIRLRDARERLSNYTRSNQVGARPTVLTQPSAP